MNAKKLFFGLAAAAAAAGAVASFALVAGAETVSSTTGTAPSAPPAQMVLQVGPAGRTLLRGTVASVSNGSLTVKSWGGDWTIAVGSATQILPGATGNDLSRFKSGDYVGVQGTINQGAAWTIDATVVRDWTYRKAANQERKQNIESARQTIRSGTPKNYVGTAGNASGSSFTLTVDGAADTVNIASGAQVVNRNWLTIQPSNIKNGDNVRVWGAMNASGTITAQIVRDTSIPATQKPGGR